MSISITPYHL